MNNKVSIINNFLIALNNKVKQLETARQFASAEDDFAEEKEYNYYHNIREYLLKANLNSFDMDKVGELAQKANELYNTMTEISRILCDDNGNEHFVTYDEWDSFENFRYKVHKANQCLSMMEEYMISGEIF